MPLVPLRSDYVDASFDFGNELAAWRPLPLSEPQRMFDSFVRPAASSGERRQSYRATELFRETTPLQLVETPAPVEAAEPVVAAPAPAAEVVAAAEPIVTVEPVVTEPEPAAPVKFAPQPERMAERPARAESRRFHLLHHFDRPIVIRSEARELTETSQGGAR
jgi:hypothetical protein